MAVTVKQWQSGFTQKKERTIRCVGIGRKTKVTDRQTDEKAKFWHSVIKNGRQFIKC